MNINDFNTIRDAMMFYSQHSSNPAISPELKKVMEKAHSFISGYFNENFRMPETCGTGLMVLDLKTGKFNSTNYQEFHCTDGTYIQTFHKKEERK